jgi:hypothetical protein
MVVVFEVVKVVISLRFLIMAKSPQLRTIILEKAIDRKCLKSDKICRADALKLFYKIVSNLLTELTSTVNSNQDLIII